MYLEINILIYEYETIGDNKALYCNIITESLNDKIKHLFHTLSTPKVDDESQRTNLFQKLVNAGPINDLEQEKLLSK